jgi:hypothetical protein
MSAFIVLVLSFVWYMSRDRPVFFQVVLRNVYKQDSEAQKMEDIDTKWPLTPDDK